MDGHIGIETLYVSGEIVGIIRQSFAAEPHPFLKDRIVQSGYAVGLGGGIPFMHLDPVHVGQSEAPQGKLFGG